MTGVQAGGVERKSAARRLIFALAGLAVVTAGSASAQTAAYQVTWSPTMAAHVGARLSSPTCTFGTGRQWSTFFEGDAGWSRFISNLSVTDSGGRPLALTPIANGRWQVGDGGPCEVNAAYDVDFEFGRRAWEAGNEQVALLTNEAVYTTGLPLFLIGEADGPATVEVRTPPGWVFATPWTETSPGVYSVANQRALLSNTMVAGRTYVGTFRAGQFEVVAALVGDMSSGGPQLQAAFSRLAPAMVDLFGDEASGRYMFAVIPGPEDGESFADSFAVSTAHAPDADNRIIWGNHLAHELLHYWIGHKIAPASSQAGEFKWFTEGFTEYFANLLLAETGIYSQSDFRDRMGRHMGLYLLTRSSPLYREATPVTAGARQWPNRPLIYSGGATLAFCLDARITTLSAGARSLRDVMRRLQADADAGQSLSESALVAAFSEAAGEDMGPFYRSYIAGTETLPIETCAAEAGLAAYVQGYDVFLRDRP